VKTRRKFTFERGHISTTSVLFDFFATLECLQCWIALDAVFLADALLDSAVDFSNDDIVVSSLVLGEIYPCLGHLLAVATPRGEKLDESNLFGRCDSVFERGGGENSDFSLLRSSGGWRFFLNSWSIELFSELAVEPVSKCLL
jgi:hypothetical protein